jgi:hypothetical protein
MSHERKPTLIWHEALYQAEQLLLAGELIPEPDGTPETDMLIEACKVIWGRMSPHSLE